jgi:hypothetical protein
MADHLHDTQFTEALSILRGATRLMPAESARLFAMEARLSVF